MGTTVTDTRLPKKNQVVATRAIAERMGEEREFLLFINAVLTRFYKGDWGCVPDFDKKQNDNDYQHKLAAYMYNGEKIWIDYNEDYTTIMYPREY